MMVAHGDFLFIDRDESGRLCVSDFANASALTGALSHGLARLALQGMSTARTDGDDSPRRFDAQVELQAVFHGMSNRHIAAKVQELSIGRQDAFSAGMGSAEPLDMTSITNEVLAQPMPELTGNMFMRDATLCAPGAAFFRQRRSFRTGQAAVHGGGNDVPMANAARTLSGARPTKFLVAGAQISIFDKLASDFSGTDRWKEQLEGAHRGIEEYHDDLTWNGNATLDIWGILNHPWLDVGVSSVAITSASTAAQIMAAFTAYAKRARKSSRAVYAPNAVVMSEGIQAYLTTTLVDVGNGSNITIYDMLKKMCPELVKWSTSWRLDSAGPSSAHGILFYRDDKYGPVVVTPIETTMLPLQTAGFNDTAYLFKQIGGVWMREAPNQLLCWFTA